MGAKQNGSHRGSFSFQEALRKEQHDNPSTSILELWQEGCLVDVHLHTGDGGIVPAHKIILAAASPFFKALFVGSGQEMLERCNSNSITLPGVDQHTLKTLLTYVYGSSSNGSSGTTEEEAEQDNDDDNNDKNESMTALLAAASYLNFPSVREACISHLCRHLGLPTAVSTFILAERYDCSELVAKSKAFLQSNFTPLLNSPHAHTLQLLPLESFVDNFIAIDELDVVEESDVARAVAIWIAGDVERRLGLAHGLLRHIRSPLASSTCAAAAEAALNSLPASNHHRQSDDDEFTHCTSLPAAKEAGVQSTQDIKQRIKQACSITLTTTTSGYFLNTASILTSAPRHGSISGLMAVGGLDEGWRALKTVEVYDARRDVWTLGAPMPHPCSFAAAVTLGGRSYAFEGSAHLPVALTYDRHAARWEHILRPPTARVNMAAAALSSSPSSCVFLIGGRMGTGRAGISLSSIDAFDPESESWMPAGTLLAPRTSLAACAVGGQQLILAIGGQGDRTTYETAEAIYPERGQSLPIRSTMSCARKYLGAVEVGGQVLAVGGVTASRKRLALVEAYDPREGRWRELAPMSVPRSSFGVAVLHGEVFVAGGAVGESDMYEGVDCYSVTAGRWRRCAALSVGRSGLAMTPV